MTDNEVRALMLAVAEIRGDVKRILHDNERGEQEHNDFELRLRALERVRWLIAGACTVLGSGIGAAATQLLG